jgi:hypothetical protein
LVLTIFGADKKGCSPTFLIEPKRRPKRCLAATGSDMLKAAHLTGLLLLSVIAAAEARHRYYGRSHSSVEDHPDGVARKLDPRFSDKRAVSTLGPAIDQMIGACGEEAAEIKKFPVESVSRTIKPDRQQGAALENIRRVMNETANGLWAKCPTDVEAVPAGRLDALGGSLDAVETALDALQPPLQALYGSLREDQRAALVARLWAATGDPSQAAEPSQPRTPSRPSAAINREMADGAVTPQIPQRWNCEKWQTELRAWPIAQVEQIVQVGARQRAAFYELAASFQRAADMLADACPETAATPFGRMSQIRKSLDAIRRSIAVIRPALTRLDGMLDRTQRTRLREVM